MAGKNKGPLLSLQRMKNNTVPDMEARLNQIYTTVKEKTVSLAKVKKERQKRWNFPQILFFKKD